MIRVAVPTSRKEFNSFIKLPRDIYRGCPGWAPPLWSDERKGYRPENPVLAGCEYQLMLAYDDADGTERPVGRMMVYIDKKFNEHENRNAALFGAFDVHDNPEAAVCLTEEASSWARDHGADHLLGPINPVAEFWGILIDSFDSPAMFLTPYNHAYYADHLQKAGFKKEIDLWAYEGDSKNGYGLPERYTRFLEIFHKKNPQFTVRRFNMRELEREATIIHRISDIALSPNWGYVPVSREVMLDMVKRLKPILDPDLVWFVEKDGDPVGFCLGWPDFNIALRRMRGRLLPFGWRHLFTTLPRTRDYRLFGLAVLPEYHGMGLDALLYIHLYRALAPKGIRLEANFILETNAKMNNALVRLGLERTKTYRMFVRPV